MSVTLVVYLIIAIAAIIDNYLFWIFVVLVLLSTVILGIVILILAIISKKELDNLQIKGGSLLLVSSIIFMMSISLGLISILIFILSGISIKKIINSLKHL